MLNTKNKALTCIATFVALLFVAAGTVSAQTFSFDPSALSLTPGQSVVGNELILPNLNIAASGDNDVRYISEATPALPVANHSYGANLNGVMNIHNACLPKDYGFADIGDITLDPFSKNHDYIFTLINGVTAQSFNLQIVDWGDYLPFGACPNGHCSMTATAFNSNGDVVATQEKFFTATSAAVNRRNTLEYGQVGPPGDACTATNGQPGNFWFNLNGSGITQVTLHFDNIQSQDPHTAIADINYTAEERIPVTPPTQADMCANIDGVQTTVPADHHLDASGANCVQFSVPGAPEGNGGGQVLGTSTGSVLGVSTLGATGAFVGQLMNVISIVGLASIVSGMKVYSSSKKNSH